jgi:hypothetical protein
VLLQIHVICRRLLVVVLHRACTMRAFDSDECSDLRGDMPDTLVRARCQNVLFWVRPMNALRIHTGLRLSITPSGTHGRRGQEARPA